MITIRLVRKLALATAWFWLIPGTGFTGDSSKGPPDGNVLVWISLDGIRPDYLERAETPFFDRIMAEGA